ncbi:MAG: TIGR00730 family Rossman fold protein [Ancalomicrobiaceae bacterium]|nr:TIGR00730 family Rossman fold protein [Ancalomicrobiaceae bacterium]
MTKPLSICVYCGSGFGNDPAFQEAAEIFGTSLGRAGMRLVYGGGGVGLMGTVAKAALAAGSPVLGIIPRFLVEREVMLPEVTELVVTEDMHERKRLMFEAADAFVALPGGIGTLEELVEQMTWSQLGRHSKPIVLADIGGFWSPLIDLLSHMRALGFIRPESEVAHIVATDPAHIVPLVEDVIRRRSWTAGPMSEVIGKL